MKLPMEPVSAGVLLLGSNINTSGLPLCGEMDVMESVPQYGPSKTSSTIHGPFSGATGSARRLFFLDGGTIATSYLWRYLVSQPGSVLSRRPSAPYFTIRNSSDIAGDWVFNHQFFSS